jgi:hypothetical protein
MWDSGSGILLHLNEDEILSVYLSVRLVRSSLCPSSMPGALDKSLAEAPELIRKLRRISGPLEGIDLLAGPAE